MKQMLIAISKRYPSVRVLRHHYVIMRNNVSWLRHVSPLQKRTIVFQAYNGRYTCSPKAIYESMLKDERYANYSFIWVVRDCDRYKTLARKPRTTLVAYRSREYFKAFATAKYWIVNGMLPLRITKRPGQVMVQCWHGTPLKRLRHDIIEETQNAMNSRQDFIRKNLIDARRYDYFISPSRFATEKFVSAFGIERMQQKGRILEIGYPRNDALARSSERTISKLKRQFGIPENKTVVLYAPTWRDDQHDARIGYTHKNQLNFSALQRDLGSEYVVLFRAHYLIANQFNFKQYEGFVIDVSDHDDINDLYLVSDALITDYSSVMFDYANLGKPMLFYMYDQEHYEHRLRGFYFDAHELPGEIIKTQTTLTKRLQHLDSYAEKYAKPYDAFARKYTYLDDGKAAKRLLGALFDPPPGKRPAEASDPKSILSTTNHAGVL